MQPTLFLSHGSPLHALNAGAAGEVWAQLAQLRFCRSKVEMIGLIDAN